MEIDSTLIKRLVQLSNRKKNNVYNRFSWPETIKGKDLWCDEDLLTTYGTKYHDLLSDEKKYLLSKWEAINFYSLNVYGIKGILSFVSQCLYESKYMPVTNYLHIFMAEENEHMWFFANFCLKYTGTIYPDITIQNNFGDNRTARTDFTIFLSTMIFEEFVDYYNTKVGNNTNVPTIIKEINYAHHVDESRHISFGRELIKSLYSELVVSADNSEDVKAELASVIKSTIVYFVRLMYNPLAYKDSNVYSVLEFKSQFEMREVLLEIEERRIRHDIWFKRTVRFFHNSGMINERNFLLSDG